MQSAEVLGKKGVGIGICLVYGSNGPRSGTKQFKKQGKGKDRDVPYRPGIMTHGNLEVSVVV